MTFQTSQFVPGVCVQDNFDNFALRPAPSAYWWTILTGNKDEKQTTIENQTCALQSCVQVEQEDNTRFLRLKLLVQPTAGIFTIATLSEQRDGYSYGEPGPWTPESGKPVVFETRLRFSSNMQQDGSGGGIGTSGIWLWSNPYDVLGLKDVDYPNYHAFGFTWTDKLSIASPGFTATLIKSAQPVYSVHMPPLNLTDWNTYQFVWSVGAGDVQCIDYIINGQQIGSTPMINGNVANLSVKIWMDNLRMVQGDHGYPVLPRIPVMVEQYLDLQYIKIEKQST